MDYLKQKLYDPLWRAIIRPNREDYSEYDLGPPKFKYRGRCYQRRDFDLPNRKGLLLKVSLFREIGQHARKPLIIILHGNSSSRLVAFKYMKYLFNGGFDVLSFDFSGSGKSEGEFVTLGINEREDLDVVLRFLEKEAEYDKIVLWGRSMGAVTALLYVSMVADPRVAAVVADSPFCDLHDVIKHIAGRHSFLPDFLTDLVLEEIRQTVIQKTGVDVVSLKPLEHLTSSQSNLPIMFVAAKGDALVPPSHAKRLYDAYGGQKDLINCEGGHNDDRMTELKEIIVSFLRKSCEQSGQERPRTESGTGSRDGPRRHRLFERGVSD